MQDQDGQELIIEISFNSFPTSGEIRAMFGINSISDRPEYGTPATLQDPPDWRPETLDDLYQPQRRRSDYNLLRPREPTNTCQNFNDNVSLCVSSCPFCICSQAIDTEPHDRSKRNAERNTNIQNNNRRSNYYGGQVNCTMDEEHNLPERLANFCQSQQRLSRLRPRESINTCLNSYDDVPFCNSSCRFFRQQFDTESCDRSMRTAESNTNTQNNNRESNCYGGEINYTMGEEHNLTDRPERLANFCQSQQRLSQLRSRAPTSICQNSPCCSSCPLCAYIQEFDTELYGKRSMTAERNNKIQNNNRKSGSYGWQVNYAMDKEHNLTNNLQVNHSGCKENDTRLREMWTHSERMVNHASRSTIPEINNLHESDPNIPEKLSNLNYSDYQNVNDSKVTEIDKFYFSGSESSLETYRPHVEDRSLDGMYPENLPRHDISNNFSVDEVVGTGGLSTQPKCTSAENDDVNESINNPEKSLSTIVFAALKDIDERIKKSKTNIAQIAKAVETNATRFFSIFNNGHQNIENKSLCREPLGNISQQDPSKTPGDTVRKELLKSMSRIRSKVVDEMLSSENYRNVSDLAPSRIQSRILGEVINKDASRNISHVSSRNQSRSPYGILSREDSRNISQHVPSRTESMIQDELNRATSRNMFKYASRTLSRIQDDDMKRENSRNIPQQNPFNIESMIQDELSRENSSSLSCDIFRAQSGIEDDDLNNENSISRSKLETSRMESRIQDEIVNTEELIHLFPENSSNMSSEILDESTTRGTSQNILRMEGNIIHPAIKDISRNASQKHNRSHSLFDKEVSRERLNRDRNDVSRDEDEEFFDREIQSNNGIKLQIEQVKHTNGSNMFNKNSLANLFFESNNSEDRLTITPAVKCIKNTSKISKTNGEERFKITPAVTCMKNTSKISKTNGENRLKTTPAIKCMKNTSKISKTPINIHRDSLYNAGIQCVTEDAEDIKEREKVNSYRGRRITEVDSFRNFDEFKYQRGDAINKCDEDEDGNT